MKDRGPQRRVWIFSSWPKVSPVERWIVKTTPPDPALLFLLSLHHLMLRVQRQRKENRLSAKLLFLHLPVLFGKFWASDANTWVSVSSSAKMGWREVPASFF